ARPERDPYPLQGVGGARVPDLLGTFSADVGERSVDRADHIGQRDLIGRPGQDVTPLRTPLSPDQAGPAHLQQDVLEIFRGHVLPLSKLAHRGWPIARGGELGRGTESVVDTGRKSHVVDYPAW